MSTYAKINSENIVENIIECEDTVISTISGHYIKVTEDTKNAQNGYTFNPEAIKFISPKPFESWTLNASYEWESPTGDKFILGKFWDEDSQEWKLHPTE